MYMIKPLVIATVLLSTEGSSVGDSLTYLSNLFNVTATTVADILLNFKFINVPPENVTIFQYFPSNETTPINTSRTLNLDNPTKIIIHGWISSGRDEWVQEMAYRLYQIGQFNVLSVDWSIDASSNYVHAASATRSIGDTLGEFISRNNLSKIHIIGHSLGAHIAGFTGKKIKLDRISALDPTSPLFETSSKEKRMDTNDAGFVDVIHTQIGTGEFVSPIGHLDCYVNGGLIQPKCVDNILKPMDIVRCGHLEAYFLYSQSISYPEKYRALECSDLMSFSSGSCDGNRISLVGYGATIDSEGIYYISIDEHDNVVKP